MAGTAARHWSCQRSTLLQSASGMRAQQEGQRLAEGPTDRHRRKHSRRNACPREKRHHPAACSPPRQKAPTAPSGRGSGAAGGAQAAATQAAASSAALGPGATKWMRLSPISESPH
eukprot:13830015-Alexandrium_andersonii.AAC.1